MKSRIVAALFASAVALGCPHASAGSTIDPDKPANGSPLNSAPLRANFQAAYNDINNILSMYYGPTAPSAPSNFQSWANSSAYPVVTLNYYNAATATWVQYGVLNVATNTYASSVGATATAPLSVTFNNAIPVFALNYSASFSLSSGALALNLPTPSIPGGIFSSTAPANQFATGVNTSGNFTYARPSFGNISGINTASQGGSGIASPSAHSLMIAEGASPYNLLAANIGGRVLLDQGSGVDPAFEAMSGDATLAANGALTLATVLATPGSEGSTTSIPTLTVDAKGRVTTLGSTPVANLTGTAPGLTAGNAQELLGGTWASPGNIGSPTVAASIYGLPNLSTNVESTGLAGWDNAQLMLYQNVTSVPSGAGQATFRVQRHDTFTGGAPGTTDQGIWGLCTVDSGVTLWEFCGLFKLDNYATTSGSQNVALYGQALREPGAAATWATTFELLDLNTSAPTLGSTTQELDLEGQTVDTNNQRTNLDLEAKCQTAIGVACTTESFEVGYGIRFHTEGATRYKSAIALVGDANVVLDCTSGTIFIACIHLSDGQVIDFSSSTDESLYYSGGSLRFRSSNVDQVFMSSSGVGYGAATGVNGFQATNSTDSEFRALTTGTHAVDLRMDALDGSAVGIIGTFSNHDLVFDSNDAEHMRLSTTGGLNIGTTGTDPGAKNLRVEGSVNSIGGYSSNGSAGLTQTCTVNQAKTLVFTLGILTGGTCNT